MADGGDAEGAAARDGGQPRARAEEAVDVQADFGGEGEERGAGCVEGGDGGRLAGRGFGEAVLVD